MNTILVAMACSEHARWSMFYQSLMEVRAPAGYQLKCAQATSYNVAHNRNLLTKMALALGCSHIWYVDDDQIFTADTLERLVSHDVDVVSGLYVKRSPPFPPLLYQEKAEGPFVAVALRPEMHGLVEVAAAGAGCLLVKTDVLRTSAGRSWWTVGQLDSGEMSEDLVFCRSLRQAGFKVYVDTDCPVGHVGSVRYWPQRVGGYWATAVMAGDSQIAMIPAVGYATTKL